MSGPDRIFAVARAAAFLAVVAMMATTLADIALRTAGRWAAATFALPLPVSVPGAVDLVEAAVVVAAFLAIPVVFFEERHVGVEVLVERFGPRARLALGAAAALLGGLFMAACALTAWDQAVRQWSVGYRTATIGIPLWWFWVVILVGCALSVLACAASLVRNLRRLRTGH